MTLRPTASDFHIRPINLRTDLAAISDLVETCFAEHMDGDGRDYLRHMRQAARAMSLMQYAGSSPETSIYPFHGYVWEEDGRIIGNLTLIYMKRRDRRVYFIANVATHPSQRGRGIARALTERAIAHVRERNGSRIYLQVRDDNPTAFHIYSSTGFEEIARRTSWIANRAGAALNPLPGIQITRRQKEDWKQQKLWLSEIYPDSIAWNLPFHPEELEPGFFAWVHHLLNGDLVRHWSARNASRLIGVLSWQGSPFFSDPLWLATSPAYENDAIMALIPRAMRSLGRPGRILLNYPAGRGVEAFQQAGLKELHTLIWMVKEVASLEPK